jgi:hypothetical protein
MEAGADLTLAVGGDLLLQLVLNLMDNGDQVHIGGRVGVGRLAYGRRPGSALG